MAGTWETVCRHNTLITLLQFWILTKTQFLSIIVGETQLQAFNISEVKLRQVQAVTILTRLTLTSDVLLTLWTQVTSTNYLDSIGRKEATHLKNSIRLTLKSRARACSIPKENEVFMCQVKVLMGNKSKLFNVKPICTNHSPISRVALWFLQFPKVSATNKSE
jgi:hypothetical protein